MAKWIAVFIVQFKVIIAIHSAVCCYALHVMFFLKYGDMSSLHCGSPVVQYANAFVNWVASIAVPEDHLTALGDHMSYTVLPQSNVVLNLLTQKR